MRNRLKESIAAGAAMLVLALIWPTARPQVSPDRSRSVSTQVDILRSSQKPKVPISDGNPESSLPRLSASELDGSMRMRRDSAWRKVQQVWEPEAVGGSKLPAWITWYEQPDIAQLYREVLAKQRSGAASNVVAAVMKEHTFKDLQASLTSARMGTELRQFTFPGMPRLGPNRRPATGVIYYNTAYVRHLLENAEKIARCDPAAYPRLVVSSPLDLVNIDKLPLQLIPTDPQNRWALCMEHEMPPEAMMLKVNWVPVKGYDTRGNAYVAEHDIDTSAKMSTTLLDLPSGRWIEIPWDETSRSNGGIKATGFRVTDEQGKEWEMRGMHIVKKDVRTWTWTTFFEAGGQWNWGADKPSSLAQQWSPLVSYGMCTVSNFRESDPAPWSAYEGKDEHLQSLADAIQAVAKVMKGAQWCSNPYIETNLAFGNCLGCHQGSTETILPTTVFEAGIKPANRALDTIIPETILKTTQTELPFNTSDFSFSFAINRSAFQEALRQHRVQNR